MRRARYSSYNLKYDIILHGHVIAVPRVYNAEPYFYRIDYQPEVK